MDTTENVTPITSNSRRKQQSLPGIAPQTDIPAVEDAAAAYVEIRNERMELTKREKELKVALLVVCTEHNVERYTYVGEDEEEMVVKVKTKQKVTVRKASSDGAEGDEDEE